MTPLDIIWWALAILAVVFIIFLVVSITVATIRTIKQAFRKPDDRNIIGGRR